MTDELARVYKTDRERNRARKKRAGIEEFVATRQLFFDGEFDAYVWPLTQCFGRMPLRALFGDSPTVALPRWLGKYCCTQPSSPSTLLN